MNSKLKNVRATKRKYNESHVSDHENTNINDIEENVESVTDRQKNDVESLKAIMVNAENMAEIKNKLKFTLSYRLEMMKAPELDVKESFPYFFTDPALVNKQIILELFVSIHHIHIFPDSFRFLCTFQRC